MENDLKPTRDKRELQVPALLMISVKSGASSIFIELQRLREPPHFGRIDNIHQLAINFWPKSDELMNFSSTA